MRPVVLFDGRPAQGHPRGMGMYCRQLLPQLAQLGTGWEFKVALDRKAGEDPWPELAPVEKVWGSAGNPIAWEQFQLPRLALQARAELLHCTANSAPCRCPIPYVVTIHDAIFLRKYSEGESRLSLRHWIAHAYYHRSVGPTARRARWILTDSECSRDELVAKLKLPPERIEVAHLALPHPVSALPEVEAAAVLRGLGLQKPFIMGFGALDRRKNTDNLVRAFARLPRTAAMQLVLVGFEQVERSFVPQLIEELGVGERVKVLGYLSEPDLIAVFQNADLFVYPTRAEGFGLPLLQAFSLGVPVLTTRSGSIPEIAGQAVHFTDPEDVPRMTQEMLNILVDSSEAHHLAMAGYLQAQKFTWQATAKKTLAVYQQALGPEGRSPALTPPLQ